ncbi:MAG: M20/M25/M40 family metallo-hydrolase, partial [Nocardioidaceae bacterium]|nr:M20/M25/M40 family metallo-hydrolase [Nocardioidaceae bacterium]
MRPRTHAPKRRWAPAAALTSGLALAVTTALVGTAPASADTGDTASRKLRTAVSAAGIAQHLRALDSIAAANDGTRASGTSGYAASRDYVVSTLRAAGYTPKVQTFDFPFFKENRPSTLRQVSPDATTYTNPDDFATMTYSASGDVNGQVVPVDTDLTATDASTSGCEAADFAGFPAGAVALVQRGTCTFGAKVQNAADAGAAAAIVFNRGTTGNTGAIAGTLGAPAQIPALGASFALGQDLASPSGTTVALSTDTVSEIRPTYNITADTPGGRRDNVVMAGSHLDSVVPGAGINDNGTGSATLLELAKQMSAQNVKPRNTVRFAWWGAEELGLLGSTHYVQDLADNDPQGLKDIRLYLNFDMIGSPNYVRFVYDGDNSRFGEADGAAVGPPGSGEIEKLFADYFAGQGLPSEETPFSGRSDYGPFIEKGIASGGLFTGAEGVKTAEQAATYGGTAGEAYDHCYHQACDTIANVNLKAVDEMSDAVVHAVATYGFSTASLPEPAAGASARRAT